MAVTHTEIINGTDYGFDFDAQRIHVEAGVTVVSAADLKAACRRAESSTPGMVWPNIIDTGNPVTLTASSSTFQVNILLDGWKILSLSTSGTFTMEQGNTVHINDGIDIFAANPSVSTVNNISAAGVLVETGVSGLTAAESAMLLLIKQQLANYSAIAVGGDGSRTITVRDSDDASGNVVGVWSVSSDGLIRTRTS